MNPIQDRQRDLFEEPKLRFNGSDYDRKKDDKRLTGQILRIFQLMKDEKWRTLGEIEIETGDPQSSISAQLRHMRKERFGAHEVNKRSRGLREHGLFEYQLVVNKKPSIKFDREKELRKVADEAKYQ